MSIYSGRAFLAVLLATLGLLLAPGAANPAGQIVVYGAHSGSTLTLHLSGDGKRIVVKGLMARTKPKGCRLERHRTRAICRVAGASSIMLVMGPSGDFVRVADRMPMALTVYLGDGSDKFIGNAERDTCYPGGAKRNRCVGGAGDDVCITGNRNSDCVGGPGDDYCRHGRGSDGCWGGPGNDICVMGPGQDGCHGDAGNDRLFGGRNPDRLYGGAGWDYCDGQHAWGRSQGCEAGPRR
jgi:Ca2+-binding RTX toxin-like protein